MEFVNNIVMECSYVDLCDGTKTRSLTNVSQVINCIGVQFSIIKFNLRVNNF